MNEVNPRRTRLVLGWVHDRLRASIPSRVGLYQPIGQLSLACLRGRLIAASAGYKGWNVMPGGNR